MTRYHRLSFLALAALVLVVALVLLRSGDDAAESERAAGTATATPEATTTQTGEATPEATAAPTPEPGPLLTAGKSADSSSISKMPSMLALKLIVAVRFGFRALVMS